MISHDVASIIHRALHAEPAKKIDRFSGSANRDLDSAGGNTR
jgi:hypothetical protein